MDSIRLTNLWRIHSNKLFEDGQYNCTTVKGVQEKLTIFLMKIVSLSIGMVSLEPISVKICVFDDLLEVQVFSYKSCRLLTVAVIKPTFSSILKQFFHGLSI